MANERRLNGAVGGQNGSPADVPYAGTNCSLTPRQMTRYIIVEVINSRFAGHGYRPLPHDFDPNSIQRTPPIGRLSESARELVLQFEARYMERNQEDLSNYQIDPERFEDAYHVIIAGIFVKGINWGRVIALMSLASMMSTTAMRSDRHEQVPNIVTWTCSYIVDHLWPWMMAHEGWDSILEMTRQDFASWDNIKSLALCTIGAIGLLGVGVLWGKR